ncbi:NAC domain-containing protein 104 [Eucalyptus grandis]|uniref:NAC domain-containing protein 104 n=1 Tax=Eucalyptus grandis TaxID=71139 RepID=UPI00192E787C|nr:NAC domain-containing protein 104 [Eucalyptus grandis]
MKNLSFTFCVPRSSRPLCLRSMLHLVPDLKSHHHDPWDLHGKALWNGTHYFYFSRMMNNRITENGYWKDLDMEEPVFGEAGEMIGMKKSLTFHIGEAPTGQETNWMMQEYHLMSFHQLANPTQELGSLVLSRVHESKTSHGQSLRSGGDEDSETDLSYMDEMFMLLDEDLDDISSGD